jgi:hypothetical protein
MTRKMIANDPNGLLNHLMVTVSVLDLGPELRVGHSRSLLKAATCQNRSRLIMAFARPPVRPATRWLAEVIEGGGTEKDHHDWEQGVAEARFLLTWMTEPGDLVVDPFCGGGTIPAACKGSGRD